MRLIKRISTSLSASVHDAVGRMENHDAIVEASIREQKQVLGKTRARLKTLLKQQGKFEQDKQQCEEQIERWTHRAKTLANDDQEKALTCLARRKQLQQKLADIDSNIKRQQELTHKLQETARELERKLEEASRQHNMMRARQSVADANVAFGQSTTKHDHLDEVFERWESNVMTYEDQPCLDTICDIEFDALSKELDKSEQQEELAAELRELMAKDSAVNPTQVSATSKSEGKHNV